MNLEKLDIVVTNLSDSLESAKATQHLNQIINAINNQISSPSEGHLNEVSQSLENLKKDINESYLSEIPKTWNSILEEIDAADLVGTSLYDRVKAAINNAGPMLNEAIQEIRKIIIRIDLIIQAKRNLTDVFENLNIDREYERSEDAELSVLFPRSIFSNELDDFIKETKIINDFIETSSEIATGEKETAKLGTLSSSDPTIFLYINPITVKFALDCVHSILDAYEKVQKIREAKAAAELAELDASFIKKITKSAEDAIDKIIQKFVDDNVTATKVKDAGRRNELKIHLAMLLKKLAARIDRGMRIEGSADEVDEEDFDDSDASQKEMLKHQKLVEQINTLAQRIQYFEAEHKPILGLPAPEDEED